MLWNILDGQDVSDLYRSIDQSLDYFYYLLDQPLPELVGKGYYYPCLEYHEPIASWCKQYASEWGDIIFHLMEQSLMCERFLPSMLSVDWWRGVKRPKNICWCGGESGPKARPCHYDWILEMRRQCVENNVPFTFKQTGAVFIKDGKTYRIERKNQMSQARKAGIDTD